MAKNAGKFNFSYNLLTYVFHFSAQPSTFRSVSQLSLPMNNFQLFTYLLITLIVWGFCFVPPSVSIVKDKIFQRTSISNQVILKNTIRVLPKFHVMRRLFGRSFIQTVLGHVQFQVCSHSPATPFNLIKIMVHFTSLSAATMIYVAQKRDSSSLMDSKYLRFSLFSATQYDTSACRSIVSCTLPISWRSNGIACSN